ncbi:TetR/AcrR family transcriptional regulator [Chondrinema litorale]|uniref:TetR/AcrR family transcriptional regulator n=1 Tax=Chondrinema litorale TaxID=2994555 RepID=UPI0025432AE8|nr:TetR/AcrR family transcriptional regulator [Chondrinema litorale]UZR93854.1 TetR/AcrR family transcriptional regulator [Chondrinema litorale]
MSPKTPNQFQEIREKSREHLLAVSMRLFALNGYQATSISQIAKEAGVAKGALYHYFDSKETLLEEVIKLGLTNIQELFNDEELKSGDAKEQLRKLMQKTFKSMETDKEFWSLYASLITQMRGSEKLKEIFRPLVISTFDMLTNLLESNGVPDARMRALSIGGMIDGVALHYMYVMEEYPFEEVTDYIIDKMLFP